MVDALLEVLVRHPQRLVGVVDLDVAAPQLPQHVAQEHEQRQRIERQVDAILLLLVRHGLESAVEGIAHRVHPRPRRQELDLLDGLGERRFVAQNQRDRLGQPHHGGAQGLRQPFGLLHERGGGRLDAVPHRVVRLHVQAQKLGAQRHELPIQGRQPRPQGCRRVVVHPRGGLTQRGQLHEHVAQHLAQGLDLTVEALDLGLLLQEGLAQAVHTGVQRVVAKGGGIGL